MPRPVVEEITFTIDGRSVTAPSGQMLADAAKLGNVDIPVFCYEPKLGAPVGACRMCLVEVEGIPKLQTACSTPVKDGMVVDTQSDRVKAAQQSVVEFILLNHPLDCPVCDKGGECPLQDISYGWGRGESRMIEQKRQFEKPVELSPLIAIDRERCILCYRCVRFSQEVSEDYQLILHERGADTFVGTFDGHPYVAPFSGNITELCPVGALTSQSYRFRARPWDIEQSGSVCGLCPGQCNVSFTVRDDKVQRVLARDNDAVDDGWLCDRGRYAYQAAYVPERVTQPLVRIDGQLTPVGWDEALREAASALHASIGSVAALASGSTSNEEGWLLRRLMTEALDSNDFDSSAPGVGPLPNTLLARLDDPKSQATVSDLEFAHSVLLLEAEPIDDMPILDLRIRKGIRRNGVKLFVATPRPSRLESEATQAVRYAPGAAEAFVCALEAAVGGATEIDELCAAAGADLLEVGRLAQALRESGEDLVIVWGERLLAQTGASLSGPAPQPKTEADLAEAAFERAVKTSGESESKDPEVSWFQEPIHDETAAVGAALAITGDAEQSINAASALLRLAGRLGLSEGRDGAGLLQIPAATNGRGLREIGFLPASGPGFSPPEHLGLSSSQIAATAAAEGLKALYLLNTDPVLDSGDRKLWRHALNGTEHVIAHSQFVTEGIAEFATVVFPAEAYPEMEGTITHPDGRIQRLRPAVARPHDVRAGWQILARLHGALAGGAGLMTAMMVTSELAQAVPFYQGLTHDEIGGLGVRWQDREAAANFAAVDRAPLSPQAPRYAPQPDGVRSFRLGSFRSIWGAREVPHAPALQFLAPNQLLELNPEDATERDIRHGEPVVVAVPGPDTKSDPAATVKAVAHIRTGVPRGNVFLQLGLGADGAESLDSPLVEIRRG